MKSILLAGCFLLLFQKAQTQSFPDFFHRLTPEHGLSQAVNSFIFHDQHTLGLSSPTGGVRLFDTIKRAFTRQVLSEADNPRSLSDREVEEMYLDPADNIWLSHWNTGISYTHLQKQKFRHVRLKLLFPDIAGRPFEITKLVENNGAVWCATEGAGILVLQNGRAAGHFLPNEDVIFFTERPRWRAVGHGSQQYFSAQCRRGRF